MEKVKKSRLLAAVIVQCLLVVFTVWSVADMFFTTGSGNMQVSRTVIFRYFTVDSNLLCAVSSVFALFLLLCMLSGNAPSVGTQKAIMLFRYVGTSAVTVTLLTVLLFLGPLFGYPGMFAGWNLWLHLLAPLLAIFSFTFLERDGTSPGRKHLILAALPVILYGIVYVIMAVFRGPEKGGWPDFYGFNIGGRWFVSYPAMTAGVLLIGVILKKLRELNPIFIRNPTAGT